MRNKPFPAARLAAPAPPADRAPTAPGADYPERASIAPRGTNPAEPLILLSPRAVLRSLFSFEALLLLFMYGGYKVDSRFAWIPVDPTALFFALSLVVGGFVIVRNGIRLKAPTAATPRRS